MKGDMWVIVKRKQADYNEDGIRWKAFPVIDPENPQETIDIATDEGDKYYLAEEIRT